MGNAVTLRHVTGRQNPFEAMEGLCSKHFPAMQRLHWLCLASAGESRLGYARTRAHINEYSVVCKTPPKSPKTDDLLRAASGPERPIAGGCPEIVSQRDGTILYNVTNGFRGRAWAAELTPQVCGGDRRFARIRHICHPRLAEAVAQMLTEEKVAYCVSG